jgi:hypothetical protein
MIIAIAQGNVTLGGELPKANLLGSPQYLGLELHG